MNARTRAERFLDRAVVVAFAVVAAVSMVAFLIPATPAKALTVPTAARLRIVVAGPTAAIALPAMTTRIGEQVALWSPSGPVAVGRSDESGYLTLRGVVQTAMLTPGMQRWEMYDGAEPITPVTVQVARQSRVSIGSVATLPGSWLRPAKMLVTGTAKHYDLLTGAYKGDQASRVQVQAVVGGKWQTLGASSTFGPDGTACAVVDLPRTLHGRFLVRLVRAPGDTVTGGTSGYLVASVR